MERKVRNAAKFKNREIKLRPIHRCLAALSTVGLSLLSASCGNSVQNNIISGNSSEASISAVQPTEYDMESLSYFDAYRDFLLHTDIDQEHDLPIWGFYLFDLDFDGMPELGVLHDSGGSMGGYFTFYGYDGKEIVPTVLDTENNPVQISNYTQILADNEAGKIYFLKEMYLLRGNENGTYGYVDEVVSQNGVLHIENFLCLQVDQTVDLEAYLENDHYCEDDFLSDEMLVDCFLTEYCSEGKWEEILPETYLEKKRELIPKENSFVDVRDTGAYVLLCESVYELLDDNLQFHNRQMTEEEINTLFTKWDNEQN